MRWGSLSAFLVLGLAGAVAASAPTSEPASVCLIHIQGIIGPATETYISRAVDDAADQGAACLIIQLDTPGGALDATQKIVEKLLSAPLPTVVYVAPAGAGATSAGTFITLAADVAAMAPTTTIGAAHPVSLGGGGQQEMDDTMKQKVENYAASVITTIAARRHHNAEWAESAVRKSESITADKALELHVIDLIAASTDDLLTKLDGRSIGGHVLHIRGAAIVEIPMSARERVFQMLWHPEVMFILMLIAMYGIIGELSSPGAILPGVVGGIALVLLLYMMSVLPLSVAGLALVGLAILLFVTDVFATTHGVLTGGGIISFFIGSLMMFNQSDPLYRVSMGLIVPATVVTAAFFIFVVGAGLRAQWLPHRTGRESMLGMTATTLTALPGGGRTGKVFIEGEYWNAASDTLVEKDREVVVVAVEGLKLKVKPKVS